MHSDLAEEEAKPTSDTMKPLNGSTPTHRWARASLRGLVVALPSPQNGIGSGSLTDGRFSQLAATQGERGVKKKVARV
jgi:hypothetical protein